VSAAGNFSTPAGARSVVWEITAAADLKFFKQAPCPARFGECIGQRVLKRHRFREHRLALFFSGQLIEQFPNEASRHNRKRDSD